MRGFARATGRRLACFVRRQLAVQIVQMPVPGPTDRPTSPSVFSTSLLLRSIGITACVSIALVGAWLLQIGWPAFRVGTLMMPGLATSSVGGAVPILFGVVALGTLGGGVLVIAGSLFAIAGVAAAVYLILKFDWNAPTGVDWSVFLLFLPVFLVLIEVAARLAAGCGPPLHCDRDWGLEIGTIAIAAAVILGWPVAIYLAIRSIFKLRR
jgi:hypothetical protein